MDMPDGLQARGARLWRDVTKDDARLDPAQVIILEEACRMADRLDELDSAIRGKGVLNLMRFRLDIDGLLEDPHATIEVSFSNVLAEARQQANVLKQLVVALRLPDAAGNRPQQRPQRGAHVPSGAQAAGNVSSIERARIRKGA